MIDWRHHPLSKFGVLQDRSALWSTGKACLAVGPFGNGPQQPEGCPMSALSLTSSLVGLLPSLPCFDLSRRVRPLQRRRRGPFTPDAPVGPYRLPKGVRDGLGTLLAPFRNRDAAFVLATFLGRYWSSPDRLGLAFPIDRRALADHERLGLSEGVIRGAIATLERIGFIERSLTVKGSAYRTTEDGLKRKPILFRFGAAFVPILQSANRTGATKRQAVSQTQDPRPMPILPKDKIIIPGRKVTMGKIKEASEEPVNFEPSSPLEMALARLGKAITHT